MRARRFFSPIRNLFDEGLFHDELARCRRASLSKSHAFKQGTGVGQHLDRTAEHEAVGLAGHRRQADILRQGAVLQR